MKLYCLNQPQIWGSRQSNMLSTIIHKCSALSAANESKSLRKDHVNLWTSHSNRQQAQHHQCWLTLNVTHKHTDTLERPKWSESILVFSAKHSSEVTSRQAAGEPDHWGAPCAPGKKPFIKCRTSALTPARWNGGEWQGCAPTLSAVGGLITALLSSLQTRMRWKIWSTAWKGQHFWRQWQQKPKPVTVAALNSLRKKHFQVNYSHGQHVNTATYKNSIEKNSTICYTLCN